MVNRATGSVTFLVTKRATKPRCAWVPEADALYVRYHDEEWGVPVYDDQHLFEMLLLEGAQAGLSWITILRKRENYRQAFDAFDPEKIARYGKRKLTALQNDSGIVRNRLKIDAAVSNAQAFLDLQQETRSFSDYLWDFVDGQPVINRWKSPQDIPASTSASELMSKDLKRRGFKFVGPTICYAFMQATGMVNDHEVACFRHREVNQ